ncbi:Ubiquitin-conjugating enzyme E2 [Aureococcus anophagefferens]|nr:Ubiquitin-conjugating enzyme E2 [Aureococcus anophagefferens]
MAGQLIVHAHPADVGMPQVMVEAQGTATTLAPRTVAADRLAIVGGKGSKVLTMKGSAAPGADRRATGAASALWWSDGFTGRASSRRTSARTSRPQPRRARLAPAEARASGSPEAFIKLMERGLITSELRVKKDLVELASQKFTCPHASTHIDFPEGDILNMHVTISLTRVLRCRSAAPTNYPLRPPSVYCLTRVWHPNVCVDGGRVSHPLLDRDWKPVLSINTVIFGLQLLFLEPNPSTRQRRGGAGAARGPNGFAAQASRPGGAPAAGGRGARRDARHHSNDAPPPPATALPRRRRPRRPAPAPRCLVATTPLPPPPSRYEAFEELFPFPVGDGGLPDFEGTDLSHEEQCLRSVDALLESTSNDAFRVRFLEEFRFRLAEGFTSFPTLDELHYALFEEWALVVRHSPWIAPHLALAGGGGRKGKRGGGGGAPRRKRDRTRPANVKRKKVAAARAPADNAPAATVHMRGTFRRDPPTPRAPGRRTTARRGLRSSDGAA